MGPEALARRGARFRRQGSTAEQLPVPLAGSTHRGVPVVIVAVTAVVCAVLLVAAITLVVFYCCWRKHRGKQEGFLEMSDGKAAHCNQKPAAVDSPAASR